MQINKSLLISVSGLLLFLLLPKDKKHPLSIKPLFTLKSDKIVK